MINNEFEKKKQIEILYNPGLYYALQIEEEEE
jgi:hypothetical protein